MQRFAVGLRRACVPGRFSAARPAIGALACFSILAFALVTPALLGWSGLGPESLLDVDPLYRVDASATSPLFGDFSPIALHRPRDFAVARYLQTGTLAKWNPLVGCGVPLWAEQGGPFFPLKLPFYLAPSQPTYVLFLALHLVVAGLGAYFLARMRGSGQAAALAAGATFELSGPMIVWLPFSTCSPIFMLPWAVLGGMKIAHMPAARAAVGAAAVLALAASGGHPVCLLVVYVGFGAATIGALIAARGSRSLAFGIVTWSVCAVVLSALLAAPSLFPLAELIGVGHVYKQAGGVDFHWRHAQILSSIVTPLAITAPDLLPISTRFAPWLGISGLVVATAGVFARRLGWPLLVVAAVGLVLSAVPPASGWTHVIPGTYLIRPVYGWPLLALALTQALGDGVDTLASLRVRRVVLITITLAIAVPLWLYASRPAAMPGFDSEIKDTYRAIVSALSFGSGSGYVLLPAALSAVMLGACVALGRTQLARWCSAAVIVLVLGELGVRMLVFVTRQPASAVLASAPSPAVPFLQERMANGEARILGMPLAVGHPTTPMLFDLPDVRGISTTPVSRYHDYLSVIGRAPFMAIIQSVSTPRSPLLDLASVRYIAVARVRTAPLARTLEDDPLLPLVWENEWVGLYENQAALPRARIVRRFDVVADQRAAAERLKAAAAGAHHAHEAGLTDAVVLEPDANGQLPPPLSDGSSSGDRVRIVNPGEFDELTIDAHLDRPGLVVVADTYYPGWKAFVDGAPVPIFPTDLLFRAVYVPAGTHTITFRYEPRSFRFGLASFALTAALCAWLVVRGRRHTAVQ